tara:strand:+ start:1158 stop:2015 length:858 start_codon:yes stop_codon:yes gene_type:complete
MARLHTFGCSITQGFALPDVIAQPLTPEQEQALDRPSHWSDEWLDRASVHAWPQVLADSLDMSVVNHARRGSCFQQIARQCAVAQEDIQQDDTVIVMWTFLGRVSMQWPARTSVPLHHYIDAKKSLSTVLWPGFNKLFGLSASSASAKGSNIVSAVDDELYKFIHDSTNTTFNPLGVYDRYHNSLLLQIMTDGFLRSRAKRVIHLSVETDPYIDQLERAARDLDPSLQEPWEIPNPRSWYTVPMDHTSCEVILDPSIPTAENDMHPSVTHHKNFAQHVQNRYFSD